MSDDTFGEIGKDIRQKLETVFSQAASNEEKLEELRNVVREELRNEFPDITEDELEERTDWFTEWQVDNYFRPKGLIK